MGVITGNGYKSVAHFAHDHKFGQTIPDAVLNQDAIVFVNSRDLEQVFGKLRESEHDYVVISHHNDRTIDREAVGLAPSQVRKWFALNNTYDCDKVQNIPLGIENRDTGNGVNRVDHDWFTENLERLRSKEKSYDVYCNWRNRPAFRREVLDKIKGRVPIVNDVSDQFKLKLSQNEFYERLASHRFVVCPAGGGYDTFRAWAALYFGVVPIVVKTGIYRGFRLPILELDRWEDLSEERLRDFEADWRESEKLLDVEHWKSLIVDAFRNIHK